MKTEPLLAFGGYVLDARQRLLLGPDGKPVHISSRAFDTLCFLASHPHELIDKHRLIEAVWPNSVVEDNNLNQQISTLRKLFGAAAGDRRFIVTETGRGFRFVQDVQQLESIPTQNVSVPRRRHFAVAAAVVLLLLTGVAYVLLSRHESSSPLATPSIAVLPFADVSPTRDQAYFADGLSEELLNTLGRLQGLRVLGRTSSFSFRDTNQDARKIAATLGVQHVLEGSVQRDGDRLRIKARLVDGTNGSLLWADTYDRKLGDVFAIQKQIADAVATTLRLDIRRARVASSARGTRNVEAYEAYLAARAITNSEGSRRAGEAIALLERAVRLDPNFALAWAALAESYTFAVDSVPSSALTLTPLELQQRTSRAVLRAFELAPDAPETLRSAGMVSMQNRDWAEAERRLRRAVELAGPYDYDANFLYAWFLMNVGRASEALPFEERAMRAEPLLMRPVTFMAALHAMRGETDKAEALLVESSSRRGSEALLRHELIMVHMARNDRSGLRRLMPEKECDTLDNPPAALADLRKRYADATQSGAYGQLIPVALFASFLGDRALSLDALRALGPTQNLHVMWRPVLSDVRRLPGFAAFVEELGLVDYWRTSGHWGEFCRETGSGGLTCR